MICPKCSQDREFYKSIKHMCKECWSAYQADRRHTRLKNKPLEIQGRPIDLDRELSVEGIWNNQDRAIGYLSGIIDGEGHIQFYEYGGKSVQIANTELGIIEASCRALNTLGITYKVRKDIRYSKKLDKKYKDCYTIYIYGQSNFIKLASLITLNSVPKQDKFRRMVQSYKNKSPKGFRPSSYEAATLHVVDVAKEVRACQ